MDIPLYILNKITNNFSEENKIGSGGYGDVYKGNHNGEDIAVKLLRQTLGFDENPFEDECLNLMGLDHPHIVRLVGYCYEIKKAHVEYHGVLRFSEYVYRILCFEYLQGGSLDRYLKESRNDEWCTVYNIIKGVCEGLKFLHEGCKPPILHLDLKPSNILLDENRLPKICDFGLSRLFPEAKTCVTENVAGTLKYMPPEYKRERVVSPKNDIFSLGVIIIDILAGPSGYDDFRQLDDATTFIKLVNMIWRERINATASLCPAAESHQVETCIRTAIKCVDHDRNNRPTVADIVDKLEETEKRFADKSRFIMGQTENIVRCVENATTDLLAKGNNVRREIAHAEREGKKSKNEVNRWMQREDVIDDVWRSNLQKDNQLSMAEGIVGNLGDFTKDLVARRNDVHQKIEKAEREGKKSTNEVDRWLEKVAKTINDVHVIAGDCKLMKDVTMVASEKLREVQQCLNSCPNTVAVEPMPPPVQDMPGPSMSAQNSNLQDALMYINDDPTVGMIGIWGPGGVGKTHLLKNINNSLGEGMAFNYVLFITASRGCSVEKLQSQIIERLGLQSTGSKWHIIYEYMKTKSFLVLLDDLWEQINLEDVGIPYPLGTFKNLKRKVVLTARLRPVCGQMGVKRELTVAYLHEDEAWHLFAENVGVETLSSPNIERLAKELVNELKGLPLAFTVVGKAMYQKDKSQWEIAIRYMKQSCCTNDKDPAELGMETNVFRQLKFSYDNLRNDTLRECFKTCALWPEDAWIEKDSLAQCWMGLGLVNEEDKESSFRKSYSLIADLRAACLLEDPGSWIDVVKVHDVIRDMALWISCDCGENNDKWIVPAPIGKDRTFIISWNRAAKTVECISLDVTIWNNFLDPGRSRLSQLVPIGFNPVNLRILRLRRSILDESGIGNAIKNCTSLTYLDLSINRLKRIPEELCSLEKLEFLDLSINRLEEVPQCFGRLIYLKFLYLNSSGIQTIPIGVMRSLKSLQEIDLRTVSPYAEEGTASFIPGVFGDLDTLPHLKAVGMMARQNAQLESLTEASNLPIRYLTLSRLDKSALSLSDIFTNNFVQRTLYELEISCCPALEDIFFRHDTRQPSNHFDALDKLHITDMEQLKDVMWIGATPASMFPCLTCLNLFRCNRLLHVSWVMYLPSLEQLIIANCPLMVQAFMRCHADRLCNSQDNRKTFPSLKSLSLYYTLKLETIGDNGMEFPSLERLVLNKCPNLKRLPFQLDSLPLKLKAVEFNHVEDWERLECEEGVKTFLQPFLKYYG